MINGGWIETHGALTEDQRLIKDLMKIIKEKNDLLQAIKSATTSSSDYRKNLDSIKEKLENYLCLQ